MFKVAVKLHFDAAHLIRGHKGKCREIHGHRWEVEAVFSGGAIDSLGMLADFAVVKKALARIIEPLDHHDISRIPPFDEKNPTAENLAFFIYNEMNAIMMTAPETAGLSLVEIRVWESPDCWASYSPV